MTTWSVVMHSWADFKYFQSSYFMQMISECILNQGRREGEGRGGGSQQWSGVLVYLLSFLLNRVNTFLHLLWVWDLVSLSFVCVSVCFKATYYIVNKKTFPFEYNSLATLTSSHVTIFNGLQWQWQQLLLLLNSAGLFLLCDKKNETVGLLNMRLVWLLLSQAQAKSDWSMWPSHTLILTPCHDEEKNLKSHIFHLNSCMSSFFLFWHMTIFATSTQRDFKV